MGFTAGLVLAFASAIAINWAYARQHEVVASMPPLSLRRPLRLATTILRNRSWLRSFLSEGVGWLCYLAALRLSPISLVQGIGASGIAVIAIVSCRGHPGRLPRPEQLAVACGVGGLLLLSLSLVDTRQTDSVPAPIWVAVWLACTVAAAAALIRPLPRLGRAPALGLSAGLLFAAGDICSKLVVLGHDWLVAAAPLLATYALGTAVLQAAFQHGNALTGAGLATLATNAVPIVAGFVLFDEQLPGVGKSALQVLGFTLLVGGAFLLARPPVESPLVQVGGSA